MEKEKEMESQYVADWAVEVESKGGTFNQDMEV